MQMKLSGPGTGNLMETVAGFFTAATELMQALTVKAVREMKLADEGVASLKELSSSIGELARRKAGLLNEVKQLEERKKRALQPPQKQQEMKRGTVPLSPEELAAHQAKVQQERAARKAEAEAKRKAEVEAKKAEAEAQREAPLTHKPFAALLKAPEQAEQ